MTLFIKRNVSDQFEQKKNLCKRCISIHAYINTGLCIILIWNSLHHGRHLEKTGANKGFVIVFSVK